MGSNYIHMRVVASPDKVSQEASRGIQSHMKCIGYNKDLYITGELERE